MENLRFLLYQYNPRTALYFGHRYAVQNVDEGYMAGGGYILSKKAVKKFVEKSMQDPNHCKPDGGGTSEDLDMGRCLAHLAIFVDCRDDLKQKRFFPVTVMGHMSNFTVDPDIDYWYIRNQYYDAPQGGTDCCSNTSVAFHYIGPDEMHDLDCSIYHTHPFGLETYNDEVLPRKLTLREIVNASDITARSPNYIPHAYRHDLDLSEFF